MNLFHANLEIVIEMILFMHACIVKRKDALPPAVRPEMLNTKIMKTFFRKGKRFTQLSGSTYRGNDVYLDTEKDTDDTDDC